ncbi:MAG: hypothetical protein JRH18_00170 [Deltaproteobacteria bacterium]|nr:hypothetical protein [Deltaproteobacteria bacterium]MBW1961046.1 hypothetical protein [Deltaproteobacteria bacterium]MBW2150062.1 hypothetical protein [Deltaproteobacteria bacterium]
MKTIILIFVFALAVFRPALTSDTFTIPGEVFEASGPMQLPQKTVLGLRYALLRHANAADRKALSAWLKAHSCSEVTFTLNSHSYRGILCRLAYCFGRGLLLYTADVSMSKGTIIDLTLPIP